MSHGFLRNCWCLASFVFQHLVLLAFPRNECSTIFLAGRFGRGFCQPTKNNIWLWVKIPVPVNAYGTLKKKRKKNNKRVIIPKKVRKRLWPTSPRSVKHQTKTKASCAACSVLAGPAEVFWLCWSFRLKQCSFTFLKKTCLHGFTYHNIEKTPHLPTGLDTNISFEEKTTSKSLLIWCSNKTSQSFLT